MAIVQKAIRISVLIFLLMSPLGVAHADDISLLSKFQGEWTSNSDAFGQTAKSTMVWSSVLGSQFTRLDYRIEMGADGKASVFQGVAYYKSLGNDEYKAFWADNTGDFHPIKAKVDGNALVSIWGVEGSKLGRTRYELQDKNRLSVTDWIKKGDEFRQFNNNVFTIVAP